MQRLLNVDFDHEPQPIEVYKSGVDVVTRCEKKERWDEQMEAPITYWECDLDRYDSDEYIKLQMSNNAALQEQVTQTQLALVEVYEMMLG